MTKGPTTDDREVVALLGRRLVDDVAPEESDYYDLAAESFFAAGRRIPRPRRADDRLGSGLAEALVTVAPVAIMVANEVVKTLISEATKKSASAAGSRVLAVLRRRLTTGEGSAEHTLTVGERQRIRDVVVETTRRHELTEQEVDRIVESVMRALPPEPEQ